MEYVPCRVMLLDGRLSVTVLINRGQYDDVPPRIGVCFTCGEKTRRLPLICDSVDVGDGASLQYSNRFLLSEIFYRFHATETAMSVILDNGEELPVPDATVHPNISKDVRLEAGRLIISERLMNQKVRRSLRELLKKETAIRMLFRLFNLYFNHYKKSHPPIEGRVAFMSGRRTSLDGNMGFVYDELKNRDGVEIKTLLFRQSSGKQLVKNALAFMKFYATSKAVVVDDYFRLLNYFDKPEGTKVFQLWHACGAFKTFGYSRLGKPGGPSQREPNHRMYDYALVSAAEVARHYAEGFGISDSCIVSTGVPRCDVFFDDAYKAKTRKLLYQEYPTLQGKRVLLFAPTFRGNGQQSAYYPTERLDLEKLCDGIGGDWAIVLKLHPFCKERFVISERLKDRVLDLSDRGELNDLLFITDLLVTDYSSAVFEASLLDIPMLFYTFDLEAYISARDFYYRFDTLAPGKTVRTEDALINSINSYDFEKEKIEPFKNKFFDYTDCCSSKRTADLIGQVIRG